MLGFEVLHLIVQELVLLFLRRVRYLLLRHGSLSSFFGSGFFYFFVFFLLSRVELLVFELEYEFNQRGDQIPRLGVEQALWTLPSSIFNL